jgi:endonuclease YncB( thermonuclease family)
MLKLIVLAAALYGPYAAEVVEVKDGDTVVFEVSPWPDKVNTVRVRENGVDTPEKRTRNLCEKAMGLEATQFTKDFLEGKEITLNDLQYGKFAGRMLGNIYADGVPLGQSLLDAGLARPYHGGKRQPWCVPEGEEGGPLSPVGD